MRRERNAHTGWHQSSELQNNFNKFNLTLNKLILLDNLWEQTLKGRSKFWVLEAVKGSTIIVKVKSATARHELLLKQQEVISVLNKNYSRPWIKKISII